MNTLSMLPIPLLQWYREHARDLPWRRTPDPYRVWVSEIMLQQTRVAAVLGYFARFMAAFPTIQDLADAPEDVLMKQWQGLGYYSRARNLQKAARQIMDEHGGVFPTDYPAIRALAGIGDYTAAAIASICFGQPVPAVDGNLLRVAARVLADDTDITTTQGERDRLAEMIEYDPLADVHSLVYFHNELDRLDMQPDKVVSIISCDVNGLKLINDYLGHDTGNSMLQTAARLLRSSLRSTDCVARLGGDEFAVLLPRCNLRDAARVLEKIRAVFRHYNEHSGNVPVIMSFGLSGAEEAPSLREALALADRRMLHEKHGSRLVSGHAIKAWIEKRKDCVVSLEESRYDG